MGRPSKGVRRFVAGKLPLALATAASAQVPARYATVSDLVQAALAEHVGLPQYAPVPRLDNGQSLFEVQRSTVVEAAADGVKFMGGRIPMPLFEVVERVAKQRGSMKDVLQEALAIHLNLPQHAPARALRAEELLMIAG